jgi:hypothetical protein
MLWCDDGNRKGKGFVTDQPSQPSPLEHAAMSDSAADRVFLDRRGASTPSIVLPRRPVALGGEANRGSRRGRAGTRPGRPGATGVLGRIRIRSRSRARARERPGMSALDHPAPRTRQAAKPLGMPCNADRLRSSSPTRGYPERPHSVLISR